MGVGLDCVSLFVLGLSYLQDFKTNLSTCDSNFEVTDCSDYWALPLGGSILKQQIFLFYYVSNI